MKHEVEFQSHFSIVAKYYLNIFQVYDLDDTFKKAVFQPSSAQELKSIFVVPKLNKFHQSQNRIKKYQLVEAFISFLLQLLYHKTDSTIHLCKDGAENLEKELRFLRAILGDVSCKLQHDEHEGFQNLLAEFGAVANQVGRFVHSLFFSIDVQASGETDEALGVVLEDIDQLKVDIIKFLDVLPSFSRSAHTPKTSSVADSLSIVDSLIHNLRDLINREDDRIGDANDQIQILHQSLIFLQSCIKNVRAPQPSEELKEPLIRTGDMVHDAEYLIISFLVGDTPPWYLINRLTGISHNIELIGTKQ